MIFILLLFLIFFPNDVLKSQDISSIHVDKLSPDISIGEKEQLTLYKPSSILFNKSDNNIYIADAGNNRIIVCDENLQLIRIVGRFGQGPGEFDNPNGIAVDRFGKLFVYDSSNRRIQVFSKEGNYVSGFRIPATMPYPLRTVFSIFKNSIVLNIPNRGIPEDCFLFSFYSYKGDYIEGLTELDFTGEVSDLNYIFTKFSSWYIVFYCVDSGNQIFGGFFDKPEIFLYNEKKRLKAKKNISYFPEVKSRLNEWEKRNKSRGKRSGYLSKSLLSDVSFDEDYYYIGIYSNPFFPIYAINKHTLEPQKKIILLNHGEADLYNSVIYYTFNHPKYIYGVDNTDYTVKRYRK